MSGKFPNLHSIFYYFCLLTNWAAIEILVSEYNKINVTQPAITCSMLTIETLEQGVKYVQSQQESYQNDDIVNFEHISHLVLVLLLLTLKR